MLQQANFVQVLEDKSCLIFIDTQKVISILELMYCGCEKHIQSNEKPFQAPQAGKVGGGESFMIVIVMQ